MKKRVSVLLLVLVLALSLVSPALAVEAGEASDPVTWGELTKDAPDLTLPVTGEDDQAVTNQEAVAFLLRWAGMEESQLGTYPADYNAMAESMGMTNDIANYDPTATCTQANLASMKQSADLLYEALHGDTLEPLFLNGMAQPIFPYTTGAVTEGYDNANSDIIRYCVYVETNYDTDDDGKLDLVKALVQLPRAAMEGDYQAATIYEARPYITGCTSGSTPYGDGDYDLDKLYSQPAARVPAGSATTEEAAAAAQSSDWYYYNPHEDMYDYEDLEWYDYYLVRGFAVVECGGLGTKGSDGFETCGTDLEIDAFKCVIEWLNGERVAYTDKTSNITIEADWSNGKVGMTGRSYAGTTQFGLATTGVEGLETIVPVAGIASWYEYTNSQGIATRSDPAYSDWLAWYCAGRYLDEADWATIADKYGDYLNQIRQDQLATNGDYSDHWATRDYTLDAENIKCPALIVHGLNDDNVRTKEFDLMYQAYEEAGVPVKLLLHQDGHLTPTYPAGGLQFMIGEQSYDSILNKWFSHYLYGVDNGIENMAAVTAQSNNDTHEWNTYDDWKTDKAITLTGESAESETSSISSDYAAIGVTRSNWKDVFTSGSTASSAMYTMDVTGDTVLKGSVAVNFSAATTNGEEVQTPRGEVTVDHDNAINLEGLDHDNYAGLASTGETVDTPEASLIDRDALMVSAMLVDIAPEGETFPAFNTNPTYVDKTFAPDLAAAERLFAIARQSGTPCYSTSALRFAAEYRDIRPDEVTAVSCWGPNDFDTYSVHQLEPLMMLMRAEPARVMWLDGEKWMSLAVQFRDGRCATLSCFAGGSPFVTNVSLRSGNRLITVESDFFAAFIEELCRFYQTGEVRVPHRETLAIMAVRGAGLLAAKTPGVWVDVPSPAAATAL